jgi:hypothetical protein
MAGSCEYGKDSSGSIKAGTMFWLAEQPFLMKDSASLKLVI